MLFAVLACFAAGSASALTFQDRTCDNDKPTCPLPAGNAEVPYQFKGDVTLGGDTLQLTLPFEMKGTLTREQLLQAGLRGLFEAPR